ncbi:MAG: hypothetical protein FWD54_01515 [Endomicrobia bacterium]|nr:hypothetical protein [Endomicrobiia bacterium]
MGLERIKNSIKKGWRVWLALFLLILISIIGIVILTGTKLTFLQKFVF